jgi:hypothetical protein
MSSWSPPAALDDVAPFRPDALFLPNAVDYEYIQAFKPYKHGDLPDDWQPIEQAGKPVIGYSGSLIRRFDYDLFRHLVNVGPTLNLCSSASVMGIAWNAVASWRLDSPTCIGWG